MNKLDLNIEHLKPGEVRMIDGIEFRDSEFIVSEKHSIFRKYASLNEALVVLSELVRSLAGSGNYLIFTSASGIADVGGWNGVEVTFEGGIVRWDFLAGEEQANFIFEETEYRRSIERLSLQATSLLDGILLEPTAVIFPEDWPESRDSLP